MRILDTLERLLKVDPTVPDLQRRKRHEREHVLAIGRDRARCQAPSEFARHASCARRDSDTSREALYVDSEIDAGQRFIEIVDVKQDVVFGRIERAKVHQMAVAAGLNLCAGDRLAREIARHYGRRAAQKRKRANHHSPVTLGDQF